MDKSITGTEDMELGANIINNTSKACRAVTELPEESTVSLFEGLEPQNVLESMIISQMAAAHNYCLDLFKNAQDNSVQEVQAQRLKLADRLMRTFAHSLETLEKSRRNGNSRIKVEHVNVNKGGQAIVGVGQGGN